MSQRLLLLSNSTNYGGTYLGHAAGTISNFLGPIKNLLFIPYAGITIDHDAYTATVAGVLGKEGINIVGIHEASDPAEAVKNADAIAVGGGNTFALLDTVYQNGLVDLIRERVAEGMPYIGWSAGSNIAGQTIKTTNDMPIVEPPSFNALELVPFQINPHYSDAVLPNHNGETRAQRLAEFLVKNPESQIVGLPEGSHLEIEGNRTGTGGKGQILIFNQGKETISVPAGQDLDAFL